MQLHLTGNLMVDQNKRIVDELSALKKEISSATNYRS